VPDGSHTTGRVLHVTMAGERGGAEAVVESLVRAAMSGDGRYDPVVVAPERSRLDAHWRARGWQVVTVPPVPRFRQVKAARRVVHALADVVRAVAPDVVHTHGIAGQVYGGRAAARGHVPVVWHLHDCFDASWSSNGVLHRLARAATAHQVVAVSRCVAGSWRGRIADARLQVIHNGVEVVPVEPVPRVSGPLVVWCGRLQQWKGTHVFLDVAARIARQRPDVSFAIVGGSPFGLEPAYPEALRRQAAAGGLTDRLTWVGQVDDARPWLAAADVVVHTSVSPEPFGLVVAEAMAQGTPVVAFCQGGPAEIIEDQTSGLLVPPADTEAMATAVLALVVDTPRCEVMGMAGRTRIREYFSIAGMVRQVESAYDRARYVV